MCLKREIIQLIVDERFLSIFPKPKSTRIAAIRVGFFEDVTFGYVFVLFYKW